MLMKYNLIYFYILEFGVKILFANKAFTTKKKRKKKSLKTINQKGETQTHQQHISGKTEKALKPGRLGGLILGPPFPVQLGGHLV